ncbi:hypothetical protein ELQ90_00540 [Labedella phragmitis]|uniref:Uncharacterized protein n=1 Tax=Labedella phragmitis TaxID=2498849 RepID=A0A444PX77_9MICO|nr:hypothetical protein [Labedella phragmitis]RWZ52482.1 hypothetical protein ELQ90_00540 [Labedella phragmitis]
MPSEASDPPVVVPDERRNAPWRVVILSAIARLCESVARGASRLAERSRTAAGIVGDEVSGVVGDVVTDDEIEAARRLFGVGAEPVDRDPSWEAGTSVQAFPTTDPRP